MATKRWVSGAQSVTDVWTLTLSGTVTSQTYTVAIGSTSLVYVAGGGDTMATIFAALGALWNSVSQLPPAPFQELSIVVSSTSIIATQKVTGRPTTITFTTGGGSSPVSTNTIAATGPSFFDNGANWSGGSAPANSDVLVFDSGNIPCKYNLLTALTGVTVNVNPGYSGTIGLPDQNRDGNVYFEYRTSSLTLAGGTLVVNSAGIGLCRVNFLTTLTTARILNTGQRIDPNTPVVLLTGGAASSECDVTKGDVGLAFFASETATFPTLKISYASQQQSDAIVWAGVGTTVTTIAKTGGQLTQNCAATTVTQGPTGGTLTILAGAITTLNANGGTVAINSNSTIGTINIANDAKMSFDGDPRAITVTNTVAMVGPNCFLSDNQKRVSSGVLTVSRNGTPLANVSHGLSSTTDVCT